MTWHLGWRPGTLLHVLGLKTLPIFLRFCYLNIPCLRMNITLIFLMRSSTCIGNSWNVIYVMVLWHGYILQRVLLPWFVVIFGINTTSDTSKLLYVISRAVKGVKFETILKYHKWYLCQISLQIMLLFVYTTTRKRFVIFTCRHFKLSWNTTALSQLNCRNLSCRSIKKGNTIL